MPSSAWEYNDFAREKFTELAPRRILDIGPGSGKWAKVLGGRPEVQVDGQHWTGLEVFPRYILDYDLTTLYDRIIVDDVRNVDHIDDLTVADGFSWGMELAPRYDLIIMGDVLEHLQPDEADRVMRRLHGCGSALLIAGPIIPFEQGAWGGNEHETHHWHPTVDDWLRLVQPDDYRLGDVIGVFWRGKR